jgi:phosphatidylglycerophosphate synthase
MALLSFTALGIFPVLAIFSILVRMALLTLTRSVVWEKGVRKVTTTVSVHPKAVLMALLSY